MLPKRLSPAVKTFRHQRRFGNKKLPKRLPPSCCRNVLCRNVRNPAQDVCTSQETEPKIQRLHLQVAMNSWKGDVVYTDLCLYYILLYLIYVLF